MRWIGTADDLDGLVPQDEAARVERQASELRDLLGVVQPVDSERSAFVDPSVRAARVNRLLAIDDGTTRVTRCRARGRQRGSTRALDRLAPRELAVLRLVAAIVAADPVRQHKRCHSSGGVLPAEPCPVSVIGADQFDPPHP